jgi:hypothetical protein
MVERIARIMDSLPGRQEETLAGLHPRVSAQRDSPRDLLPVLGRPHRPDSYLAGAHRDARRRCVLGRRGDRRVVGTLEGRQLQREVGRSSSAISTLMPHHVEQ